MRSREYLTANSKAARPMPIACAATPIRPNCNWRIAISNPCPILPITFFCGTSTLFSMISQVEVAQIPNLSSRCPISTPAASSGTKNAVIPLCPCCLSVIAKNTPAFPSTPDVILLTHWK